MIDKVAHLIYTQLRMAYRHHLLIFITIPLISKQCNIGLACVHQSWGAMFQNWPLITYRKQILHNTDGTQTIITATKDTNGFIYGLPESSSSPLKRDRDRVLVAGRWYIHLKEPHGYLCEMHPTVRNLLIILNQLFNLNLFAGIPLKSAFLSERFNAIYFPRLCEHFNYYAVYHGQMPLLTILDRDEYTDKGIQLTFAHFDLILTDEHAEIITNVKGENIADLGPQFVKRSSESTEQFKAMVYGSTFINISYRTLHSYLKQIHFPTFSICHSIIIIQKSRLHFFAYTNCQIQRLPHSDRCSIN